MSTEFLKCDRVIRQNTLLNDVFFSRIQPLKCEIGPNLQFLMRLVFGKQMFLVRGVIPESVHERIPGMIQTRRPE